MNNCMSELNMKQSTLDFYDNNAEEYFNNTVNVDMNTMYSFFEQYVKKGSSILDFGCGSGRDSKYFIDKGYDVTAIDGSKRLCDIASKYINKTVKCIDFMDFDDKNKYDAVWSSSSLLHLNNDDTIIVMNKLAESLKNDGYIYSSWKYGDEIYVDNGKFYNNMDKEKLNILLSKINANNEYDLILKDIIVTEDNLIVKRNVKWFNVIIQKITRK